MKQVILEYGGAVIAVLGAFSFFIVFHSFFVKQDNVLERLLRYSISDTTIAENKAFDIYMNDVPPSITEKEDIVLIAQKRILLTDIFEARSGRGEILPIYLREAWDENGSSANLEPSEEGRSICPYAAGIYWAEIYAIDENGKENSVVVKLLVNER